MHKLKPDTAEFTQLREDALDLLEWSMDDISPDPAHRLQLKMGIERESHMVHPLIREAAPNAGILSERIRHQGEKIADHLFARLATHPDMARIYYDDSASFQVEGTTKPLAPKKAALAMRDIGERMLTFARQDFGIKDACFGTLAVPFIEARQPLYKEAMKDYPGEVFKKSESDPALVLSGRGQHANVSVWCRDFNLFADGTPPDIQTLDHNVANYLMAMLPGMILPVRAGNYYDIKAQSKYSVQHISVAENTKKHKNALNIIFKDDDPMGDRIECREGAADADPLDVALAAAIPATKACMENIVLEKGKMKLTGGIPVFDFRRTPLANPTDMPKSQEEAVVLFNTPDNPNFMYLDKLANAKITRLKDRCGELSHDLRSDAFRRAKQQWEAAKHLKGIGTRLHGMYCRQYGVESVMGQAQARAADKYAIQTTML